MARNYWTPEQRRAYDRQWYADNKERIIKSRIDRRNKLSCLVCGEDEATCLDFHHLDATQKDFTISQAFLYYGKDKIEKELSKCVVLCSNCHRKIHAKIIKLPV
jgi:5-methylcytosine-specific restriction endonuclease McrA